MANQTRNEVWKMFNQISSSYDRINRVLSLGRDRAWRKKVAKEMPLKPHLEVLDLATGTGDQLIALFQAGLSIQRAVGIDLAEEMLNIGRAKVAANPKIELKLGDAMSLPFADQSFDAATFSFGIRNVTDPLVSLQEIYRVLKPKGRCLILEFSMPKPLIRPFFLFYLRKILPRVGGILSNNQAAYRYLNQTIETFPSGQAFLDVMKQAGFRALRKIPMNFGGVTLYIGDR